MRKAGSGWDGEHSLQYLESPSSEDVVKYFTFDCSVTNSSDVVENNMRKDSNSTLSGWTGEHSLQYLESPVVKDFTFDCNVTNSSDVVENNIRKDSISPPSGWTEEHSLLYLESPTSSEEEAVCSIFSNGTENEVIKEANEAFIMTEINNPQENQDSKPIGPWVWGRRSLESSSEEEEVYTVYGYGREPNEEAIEETIVADPKKPQERKVGVNVKHMEYLNNDFDTEEVWDDDEDLGEGDFRTASELFLLSMFPDIKNKFFTARHEDCLLLTQREKKIGGLDINEGGDVEDVNHQFHNPEPSEIETVQIRQTLSRRQADLPSVEPPVDSGETPSSGSVDPLNEQPTVPPLVDSEKNPSSESDVQNQDGYGPQIYEVVESTSSHNGAVQPQANGARGRKSKRQSNVVRSDVQESGLKRGYDKQVVDLKMLDGRHPPEPGRDSLSSRKLQSILCSGAGAPSLRNPGHEDQLQEPPPTQVSEANIENLSDVRIVDNEVHQLCVVVSSPLAGEAVAALDGHNKIPWIRSLAEDLGVGKLPATMMVDSRSLCDAVKATTTLKDKRAMVWICALRRAPDIAAEDLKMKWCGAMSQVADPRTKGGANPDLLRLVLQLGQLNIVGVEYTELMSRRKECDQSA